MSDFKAKVHQIQFWLGLCPQTPLGSLQCSPDRFLAGFRGPTSTENGGRRKKGREEERRGKGGKEKGMGRDGRLPDYELAMGLSHVDIIRVCMMQRQTFPATEHCHCLLAVLIYLPDEGRRLSWPEWLSTHQHSASVNGHPSRY